VTGPHFLHVGVIVRKIELDPAITQVQSMEAQIVGAQGCKPILVLVTDAEIQVELGEFGHHGPNVEVNARDLGLELAVEPTVRVLR